VTGATGLGTGGKVGVTAGVTLVPDEFCPEVPAFPVVPLGEVVEGVAGTMAGVAGVQVEPRPAGGAVVVAVAPFVAVPPCCPEVA
jgi:hypothetical protein